jgi:hypothetical protein
MKAPVVPSRVHYFDKQYLRLQDFTDEQAAQLGLWRRHSITHHGPGIVVGLRLFARDGGFVLSAGLGIDLLGRELFVTSERPIPLTEFQRLGSNRLDVWLKYETIANDVAPTGYVECGADTTDTYYRSDEVPRLVLERAPVSRIDPRRPKGVPPALLDVEAQLQTTNAALGDAGVYVGRMIIDESETDPVKRVLADTSDCVYASVRAEIITHPANPTRVEVGRTRQDDESRIIGDTTYTYKGSVRKTRGFAIFVPDPQAAPVNGQIEMQPRFEINTDGTSRLRGASTLNGNLSVAGVVEFPRAADVDDTVKREHPSMYRAAGTPQHPDDELRIDLGDVRTRRKVFVIGLTKDDGTFVTSLKLEYVQPSAQQEFQPKLTIYGDLKLEGLLQSPDIKERPLSGETLAALTAAFQAGTVAAGGK